MGSHIISYKKTNSSIIVDNNRGRMDTLFSVDESAELGITSYLVCLAREVEVE